jgi:ankyrin repeat protein
MNKNNNFGFSRPCLATLFGCLITSLVLPLNAQEIDDLPAAARAGNIELIIQLLGNGFDVNAAQGDGATALHWASHRNDPELVNLLIGYGAEVDVSNDLGATPLWLATLNGSARVTDALLIAGANPNVSLKMGETPLMSAARSGNLDVVSLLINAGSDVDAAEKEKGQTALMWSVAQGHAEIADLLIKNGADVGARSKIWYQLENTAGNTNPSGNFKMAHGGSSAIMFAARIGNIDVARVLLDSGSNVNDKAASGVTVLTQAAHSGHQDLAIFLLERGADPNAIDSGYTALHAAVLRSEVDLVEALLEHGAIIDTPVEHGSPGRRFSADYSIRSQLIGRDAFWMAAKYGEVEILKILLDAGADPLVREDDGITALQVAMGNSGSSLDWRRDRIGNQELDSEDEERRTYELARILIDEGVDVNAKDSRGRSAIHHAVLKNFPSVVEYLAMRGADIHMTNDRDLTPLQLAETVQGIPGSNGLRGTRPEVAAVLRTLGAGE